MKIEDLRKKVDNIDKKILGLLKKRAIEVLKINKLKEERKIEIYSPERELKILDSLKKINKNKIISDEDIEIIFSQILSVFRALKTKLKIIYLGPEGTFSHLAALKKFGKKVEYRPIDSISDIFREVENSSADFGIVPIENSIEGFITYTEDMFFTSSLKICGEIVLNISHALLSNAKYIKNIYSNPQVFAQCRTWILKNYPKANLISTQSTAKAALDAKKDKFGACIGSKILASLYNLKIVASSIEDFPYNYTRFLVIGKNDSPPSGKDKTSILFSLQDRVGILHDALAFFKKYNINLTKIESRPSKKKPWEYYFFVDFIGHRNSKKVQRALKELEKVCIFLKILGSYPIEPNFCDSKNPKELLGPSLDR